ncbi:MAG: TolB family protein, partial [Vicinamibacterales bacterium]
MKILRPYGTWSSPLGADVVASGSIHLEVVAVENGSIYWLERRPDEHGRHVVVRRSPDGTIEDVTPPETNVRTRVHEYGGGACLVADGTLYYSNFSDQRVWRLDHGSRPIALTPPGPWRYADATFDRRHRRLICVREEHEVPDADGGAVPGEPRNTLVSISIDGPETAGDVVVEGDDFYSTPRISPDGTRLTWLSWRHPQMPWDGTMLHVATIRADGVLAGLEQVAGSPSESIVQPGWSPDGDLHFVSDRSGWWNLYRFLNGQVEALLPMDAEFAGPAWTFGNSTWAFLDSSRMVVAFGRDGLWHLATLDVDSRTLAIVDGAPEPGNVLLAGHGRAVYVGRSRRTPDALVEVDLETADVHAIRAAS